MTGKQHDIELLEYALGSAREVRTRRVLWYVICAENEGVGSFLEDKIMTALVRKGIEFKTLNNIDI